VPGRGLNGGFHDVQNAAHLAAHLRSGTTFAPLPPSQ
jgi:hypothetical protein